MCRCLCRGFCSSLKACGTFWFMGCTARWPLVSPSCVAHIRLCELRGRAGGPAAPSDRPVQLSTLGRAKRKDCILWVRVAGCKSCSKERAAALPAPSARPPRHPTAEPPTIGVRALERGEALTRWELLRVFDSSSLHQCSEGFWGSQASDEKLWRQGFPDRRTERIPG